MDNKTDDKLDTKTNSQVAEKVSEVTTKETGEKSSKDTAPAASNERGKRPPLDANKRNPRRQSRRRRGERSQKPRREFDQKIIDIRRVTRVVAGGRRFSFSVALVAGNRKGKVGVGLGKASDTALAIEKAANNAKKNMVTLNLTEENSISHEVEAKFSSSEVLFFPAPGKGVVAGSSVRNVIDLAGIQDISAKILSRSKNKLNNAKAAMKALAQLTPKASSDTDTEKDELPEETPKDTRENTQSTTAKDKESVTA